MQIIDKGKYRLVVDAPEYRPNYKPCPIEGYEVRLTARKKLAQINKAVEMAKEAKRYWPHAEWSGLLSDMERQAAALRDEINSADAAFAAQGPGKSIVSELINVKTGQKMRVSVEGPSIILDMPHILPSIWDCVRHLLRDPTGENIEVYENYDVYVADKDEWVRHVIPRYE